jgi:hypothetical protein
MRRNKKLMMKEEEREDEAEEEERENPTVVSPSPDVNSIWARVINSVSVLLSPSPNVANWYRSVLKAQC